jgi:hypothetical protein
MGYFVSLAMMPFQVSGFYEISVSLLLALSILWSLTLSGCPAPAALVLCGRVG